MAENAEIVELPAMVEDEVHRAMNEFMNMQRQGISLKSSKSWYNSRRSKQYEAEHEQTCENNLVIEAVAAEGFDATEEEIQKKLTILRKYNMRYHKFLHFFHLKCLNTISL